MCIAKENDCHACNAEGSACAMCKNGKFLTDSGVCEETCPAGTAPAGSGNFNKRCVTSTATPMCIAKENDCHACNAEGSACAMCKNGKFLTDSGVCEEACPAGTAPAGSGNFNKQCV
jgi:hypothetical protein